ncbi:primosomal replication protein PriC, partial [Enterobacter asburiae]|uniref:primosomal replication protein PriC n=1 Tax=Enterobacter asburiae TaxID=61645 RepID=UPI003C743BA5
VTISVFYTRRSDRHSSELGSSAASDVYKSRAGASASPGLGKWQRKRLENQEFERRLFEMKRERETRLNNSETLEEQQLLMREICALEGRIVRCRQALDEIERVIERLTR